MNNITAGKFLSNALRELSQEAHDTDGSEPKNKSECLARFVWDAALGYTHMTVDKASGEAIERYHPPQQWAINLIFDRLEGKVTPSDEGAGQTATLAQRVEKLDTKRFDV